jgi:hypothetical protein
MSQEIGESREAWGRDVWRMAEDFANNLKSEDQPFYIVYAAKQDRQHEGAFRQSFRFYRQRPPQIIGILVWYVDHAKSVFQLVPELSIPPDVPINPALLSTKDADLLPTVAETGERMKVLLA